MRNARPAFLFDLDGTLLDSRGDLADAANAARTALGFAPLSDADVEQHTGWGLAALLAGVIPEATPAMLEQAREIFVPFYRAHLLVRSRPFPGAEAMLAALAGHPLALVTNKPAMFTLPILDGLGWTPHFGAVICGDSLPQRKPAPEPLWAGLDALGVSRAESVFVGDTPIDAETARRAGVRFVCVGWGRAASEAALRVDDLARLGELFGA